jgi:hypothetical protein
LGKLIRDGGGLKAALHFNGFLDCARNGRAGFFTSLPMTILKAFIKIALSCGSNLVLGAF